MKYFRLNILIATAIIILGLQSCENKDFFELTNPPEFPWLNISEYERAAVSPYNYTFLSGWGGSYYINYRVVDECMTDITFRIPGASANWPIDQVNNRQTDVEADRVVDAFGNAYRAIAVCNTALDFYYMNNEDPYPDALPDEKEYNLKRIVGELHFMRALAYYSLLVNHAPVPTHPEFSTTKILPLRTNFADADAALNPVYATADSLYGLVGSDLLRAKELLPEQYIEGKHHPSYQYGRANKFAVRAMLARYYFRMGEFDKALEELDEVIDGNGGRYALNQDPVEAFNRSDNTSGNEVIWYALFYDLEKGSIPKEATLFTYLDYRAANGGHGPDHRRSTWHIFCMSHYMSKQIGWMDENLNETPQALRDKRYKQLFWRLGAYCKDCNPEKFDMQYKMDKPYIWGDKYYRGPDGRFTNVPVIRLAEMYLTRSILRFKAGDLQGAASDLNIVRKRAWDEVAAGVSYEASSEFVTAENITEDMIHMERVRELAFEGDWFTYCENLGLPIGPGDREATAPILPPYNDLYWDLPQDEIDFQVSE